MKAKDLINPDAVEASEDPAEEATETPMEEASENAKGEQPSEARIPESYQAKCESMVMSATRPQLEYLRSLITERESTLSKGETKHEKRGTFDSSDLPE